MQQVAQSRIRPSRLLVKVSRAALDEASAHFPPSGRTYPLALSRLFSGKRMFTFHCGNAATPANPTAVSLILASDAGDPENQVILNDLDNKTLAISGRHTGDRFEITRISAVHRRVGTASNHVLTAVFSLHLKDGPGVSCLNPSLYRQIAALPNDRRQTAANQQRIAHWDKYLEINEEMARADQVVVHHTRCRPLDESLQFAFTLTGAVSQAGGRQIGERQAGASVQMILDEALEDGQPAYQGPTIGTVHGFDAETGVLTVNLDPDFQTLWSQGAFTPPQQGRLFISKIGDLVQIRRLRNGLKALARGQAENPRLEAFVFDPGQARQPASPVRLGADDLLQPGLNPEQRQAVEGALASPDLFLIQGPPGTGKTTVIAEIVYQAAIRGQRVLLASQTNLAVDNALGKLVHHPAIRALRKGNEGSVQEEGRPFIEGRVVDTWLARTAAAGAEKADALAVEAARLEAARSALPDIVWTHCDLKAQQRFLDAIEPSIDRLQRRNETLDQEYRQLSAAFDQFMNDPAGPAFTTLSTRADRFDTHTLVLIGRVNAAAVRYAHERSKTAAGIERFDTFCQALERQAAATQRRLARVDRRTKPAGGADANPIALLQNMGLEFTFDDHVQQAERLGRELARLRRTAPGFLRILFGRTGAWTNAARERIAMARWLLTNQDRIVREAQAMIETIFDNPELADAIRSLTDTFSSLRESLLMSLNANLSEIDNLLEQDIQARARLAAGQQRVSDFQALLRPYVRLDLDEAGVADGEISEWYERAFSVAGERLAARQALVEAWAARIGKPDAADLAAMSRLYIEQANVIGITCNQSGSHAFNRQYPAFDVAIVDEVSKATPPELILPLLKARKIVLVGDHRQLPPMVGMETYEEVAGQLGIPEAETAHMQAGLFESLYTQAAPGLRLMLTTQYRMHPQIMETINQFYHGDNGSGGLRCGIDDPDSKRSHGCGGRAIGSGDHALWLDLPQSAANRERRVDTSYANPAEVAVIRRLLVLLSANLRSNDPNATQKVGVISFYSAQVRLLETELLNPDFMARVSNLTLRIGSVDRFQGIECPIVICSFVRNNDRGDIGFARDPRRINVALSRAQALSVIVGCSDLFCAGGSSDGERAPQGDAAGIYRTIAAHIREHGGFRNALDLG